MFEEAFGTSELDLYKDVLHVSKDCTPSQLRKGYYKQALKFHPDKNKSKEAKLKFQAISWAYSVCCSWHLNLNFKVFYPTGFFILTLYFDLSRLRSGDVLRCGLFLQ